MPKQAKSRARTEAGAARLELTEEITRRKRTEQALEREKAFSDTLIDSLPGVFFVLDSEGRYVRWNKAQEDLLGLSSEQLWHRDALVSIHKEDKPLVAEKIRQVFDGEDVEVQARVSGRNGLREYFFTGRRVMIEGAPYLVGTGIDMTKRKQAEDEIQKLTLDLERRARELAALNRAGQTMTSVLDLDAVLGTVMAEVRELLGAEGASVLLQEGPNLIFVAAAGSSSDELVGQRLPVTSGIAGWVMREGKPLLLGDARDDARFYDQVDALTGLTTRSLVAVPLVFKGVPRGVIEAINKAGGSFDEYDLSLLEGIAGSAAIAIENARLFAAIEKELLERERAETEIERRNQDLQALNVIATTISQSVGLDQILHATLDRVLEVMRIDAGWVQLLGEDGNSLALVAQRGIPESMLNKIRIIPLVPGADRTGDAGQQAVVDHVLDEIQRRMEASGEEMVGSLAGVPIRSKDQVLGVLGGMSGSPRALTSPEIQLLTTIGNQIGTAVENARLTQQAAEVEILREIDRLRSELIANVSHELRTPLGLIKISCTSLLMEDVEFDRRTQQRFLQGIDEEASKLERIVEHLLDLGRMESGRLLLDRRPVDLGQLTRSVTLTMMAVSSGHHFVSDFPSQPLVAMVDPKRIEQVLRNLLDNAVKYSPEGQVIRVQGRQDGTQIRLSVSDEGIGIPAEEHEKIFERFHRVDNAVTRRRRGAGLGLAVCKGIVEAHGGRIGVESEPGVGSTFYFSLLVEIQP